MTTNVYDGTAGMVATDSRWSQTWGEFFFYIDDSGFDKLEIVGDFVLMFAGRGEGIRDWKIWLHSGPTGSQGQPAHDGISVCMIRVTDKAVTFCAGQDIVKDGGHFAGTGSHFAYSCWSANKDARRAVETAKVMDFCTGGEVKYFDLTTRAHNLHYIGQQDYAGMLRALNNRGTIMSIKAEAKEPARFTVKQAAASNDAKLREVAAKVASGDIRPEAPCDSMHTPWTEDQKKAFNVALGEALGWKK
jgi:hypothetical protein